MESSRYDKISSFEQGKNMMGLSHQFLCLRQSSDLEMDKQGGCRQVYSDGARANGRWRE